MADGNGKYAKDAVSKALDACRDSCGRIGEFIYSRRSKIMGLYEQYFDEEENRRACMIGMRKEAREEAQKAVEEAQKKAIKEARKTMEEDRRKNDSLLESAARKLLSKDIQPEEVSDILSLPLERVTVFASGNPPEA